MACKTILYLEDDQALAFVTQRSFEKKGFSVKHYSDIETLKTQLSCITFDYAVLDLKVNNASSLPLITHIKDTHAVPILIVSGYGTIRTAVQSMKHGAINFLSKPCSIDDMINALHDDGGDNNDALLAAPSLKSQEREAIQKALEENQGNISAAARQLKMHRRTLQRKLTKKHL